MAKRKRVLKKRQVIFFYGEANSGKTTTLKELGQLLLPDCDLYTDERRFVTLKKGRKGTPDRIISCVWNGCTILIRTMGDSKGTVRENVKEFLKRDFDIAVTASHWECAGCYSKRNSQPKALASCDVHNIPRVKRVSCENRGWACYTTAKEVYMHIMHLVTTGSFK